MTLTTGVYEPRMADCHTERKHHANGLCRPCYVKQRRDSGVTPRAECHPDREHVAHGLCMSCYLTNRPETSPRATCHPDRPHIARGLCGPCYRPTKEATRKALAAYRRGRIEDVVFPVFRRFEQPNV